MRVARIFRDREPAAAGARHSRWPQTTERDIGAAPETRVRRQADYSTRKLQQQSGSEDKEFKKRQAENRSRGVRRRWTDGKLMLAIHWCGYHVVTVHSGFGLTDGATGFASRNLQFEIANLWFVLSICLSTSLSGPAGWCPVSELCSACYRGVFRWLLVCERYESLEPVFYVVAMLALAWIVARRPDRPVWQVGHGAVRGWNPEDCVAGRPHPSSRNLASGRNGDLGSNRGVVGVRPQLPLWHGNLRKLGSRLTSWHWVPAVHEDWLYWRSVLHPLGGAFRHLRGGRASFLAAIWFAIPKCCAGIVMDIAVRRLGLSDIPTQSWTARSPMEANLSGTLAQFPGSVDPNTLKQAGILPPRRENWDPSQHEAKSSVDPST